MIFAQQIRLTEYKKRRRYLGLQEILGNSSRSTSRITLLTLDSSLQQNPEPSIEGMVVLPSRINTTVSVPGDVCKDPSKNSLTKMACDFTCPSKNYGYQDPEKGQIITVLNIKTKTLYCKLNINL